MAESTECYSPTKMVITMDLETGKIEKVTDERGNPATEPKTRSDAQEELWGKSPQHVAVILYTHSSPRCGWVVVDGWPQWVCRPQ
jgi:hypothetical protein